MTDITPDHPTPVQLIHAAVEQGCPPATVDLIAALATAGIPHRVEPEPDGSGRLALSLPHEHAASTGIDAARWKPSGPPGWSSASLDSRECHLVTGRVRLPTTSLMYLQPPPDAR